MAPPSDTSGIIIKFFNPRSIAQPLLKWEVGEGQSIFLWLDNWHFLGPLFQKFGGRVVFHLGRSFTAKVASIIRGDTCKWPRPRNAISQTIIANTSASLVPNNQASDKLI